MRPGLIVILVTLGACQYRGEEPFRKGGKSPPNFSGISDAVAYSAYAVMVSWSAANDDTTEPNAIEYDVWKAGAPGTEDFAGTPTVSVVGGKRALVGGMMPGQKAYFVVRAKDLDGNFDNNAFELDATTMTPAAAPHKLSTDVQPLLSRRCSDVGQCHGTIFQMMGKEQGMDFTTPDAARTALLGLNGMGVPSMVNPSLMRLRVKSGDSGNSFIMDKILGTLGPDDGGKMPFDQRLCNIPIDPATCPISDDEIRLIAEWIDQGALF